MGVILTVPILPGAAAILTPRSAVPGVPTFASKESAWHGRGALRMVAGAWCRMGAASPASPRRVGAQRSRTVRNLRTDRAHRITTFDHHRAAHNDTSRRGHQPVLRCHYTNTPPGTKCQVTAVIDGGAIGLVASSGVLRTGDGDL